MTYQRFRALVCRCVLWGLLALLLAGGAAQAQMGLVAGSQGADALYAWVEAEMAELKSETATQAQRDKLYERVADARAQLQPMHNATRQSAEGLEARLREMEKDHGGESVSNWDPGDRAEYNRVKEAREKLAVLKVDVDGAWENLKWLHMRQGVASFNPFANPQFRERMEQLKEQLRNLGSGFAEFNSAFHVESCDADNPSGGITVVPATFVVVRNTSKDMKFTVCGLELTPGEQTQGEIRLGDHRTIVVQALSYGETRKRLISTRERVDEMDQVKVHDENLPYLLRYGDGRRQTKMESLKEEYSWRWGSQVQQAIGKASPWSPDPTVIKAPVVTSSRTNTDGDIVTWRMPAVAEGSVEFSFDVTATVDWMIKRKLADGSVKENEEPEVTMASLSVTVRGR